MKEYPKTHQRGFISIESLPILTGDEDIGIQIAKDGRIWICIEGAAFLRFSPHINKKMFKEEANGKSSL